jgi:hypothetical protein
MPLRERGPADTADGARFVTGYHRIPASTAPGLERQIDRAAT